MRRHGSQWILYKINFRHPGQLKKWKSWEPFWSYQLNSTANPAHLPQIWPNIEVNGLDWQCCLAGSSKRAPRIFIFSIVLGAENLSYIKFIETHARAFLALIILSISSVFRTTSDYIFRYQDILTEGFGDFCSIFPSATSFDWFDELISVPLLQQVILLIDFTFSLKDDFLTGLGARVFARARNV